MGHCSLCEIPAACFFNQSQNDKKIKLLTARGQYFALANFVLRRPSVLEMYAILGEAFFNTCNVY